MKVHLRMAALIGAVAIVGAAAMLGLADDKAKRDKAANPNTGVASGFCRVREIDGMKVMDPEGEDLGKIEDLVIELGDGRVSYAALSFGGVLGVGNKLFAIPWNALELRAGKDAKDRHFVLSVEKERLKNAPGFDKSRWPDMADPNWAKEIDEFYDVHIKAARRPARGQTTTPK
ncbi:MAG TPA: PRC-barrel domain-containing protein [Pirellulales bacterium]|jgi:sporulation protein YlmC with PRC-barrel domain|nr:PRC-barrel domain-containing protein [Pirellulales bacterium]